MTTTTTITDTMLTWAAAPERAMAQPAVTARSEGDRIELQAGAFTWDTALPPAIGGAGGAPSPTAYLLGALAGCAVGLIRDTLAPQAGIPITHIEATARCDTDSRGLLGMDGVAPQLQRMELEIVIDSPEGDEGVRRLVDLWQERCPNYLALIEATPVAIAITAGR